MIKIRKQIVIACNYTLLEISVVGNPLVPRVCSVVVVITKTKLYSLHAFQGTPPAEWKMCAFDWRVLGIPLSLEEAS